MEMKILEKSFLRLEKMEEGIECEGDWHIITQLPDKFELKMLQLQLLLPECLWCHSLKMVNVSVWPRTLEESILS